MSVRNNGVGDNIDEAGSRGIARLKKKISPFLAVHIQSYVFERNFSCTFLRMFEFNDKLCSRALQCAW